MSFEELRRGARRREEKSRFEARLGAGLGLALCLVFAWSAFLADDPMVRAGWSLMSLSGLVFARNSRRLLPAGLLTPALTAEATARVYRSLLEQRRDFDRRVWQSGLPLAFVGVAVVLLPPVIRTPALLPKAAPFLVLLAVWFAVYFPKRVRDRRALEREIAGVREVEQESAR